jgi:hypothetical protein
MNSDWLVLCHSQARGESHLTMCHPFLTICDVEFLTADQFALQTVNMPSIFRGVAGERCFPKFDYFTHVLDM